jgi:hypothetical protein
MFTKTEVFHGHTEGGWFYTAYNFAAAEHGGAHMDAPIHFAEGARTADQVPVDQMIGPGFVIDVSAQAAANVDYLVAAAGPRYTSRRRPAIPGDFPGAFALQRDERPMTKAKARQRAKANAAKKAQKRQARAAAPAPKLNKGQFDPGPRSITSPGTGAKNLAIVKRGAARSN